MSASTAINLDLACDRFEREWWAGREPRVEEHLALAPEADRPAVLPELILLDVYYRRRAGQTPAPSDYCDRFPGLDPDWLARAAEDDTRPPPAVPGYEVSGEIARGGMGMVYAARDVALDREVAVKVLLPAARNNPGSAARFLAEARITARLSHPGVPPVHAVGRLPDGGPFLAMKLIRGKTLADLLKDRPDAASDLPRFVGIFEQVCQAVAYAHANGVIHRDLKPHNVMVGPFGEVQVMDWGLAKSGVRRPETGDTECAAHGITAMPGGATHLPDPDPETRTGSVLGTPAYMPPEQARGEIDKVDARSDVFALGAILCTILTDNPPYSGASSEDLLHRAVTADLANARARLDACGADPGLVEVCLRCLSPEPADRPADGAAVAGAVAAYRAGVERRLREAEADRAAAAAEAREQHKRRRVQLMLAGAVGLLLLGGGAFAWWADHKEAAFDTERALDHQRAEFRTERTRAGVTVALSLSADLRRQYRFREARTALGQAEELLRGGDADDLRAVVGRANDELAFAARLDDIRYRKWVWTTGEVVGGRFDKSSAPPAYEAAFRAHGFDLRADDPADLARRIAASAIKAELVAALDDWALHERDVALHAQVLEVVRRADPGMWTDRLRDPANQRNRGALSKLASETGSTPVAPAAFVALAELMERQRLDPVPLLLAGQRRNPTEFELNFALGQQLASTDPRGSEGFYQAARVLRPDNAAVLNNLGLLVEKKDLDAAIEYYKEAIRHDPTHAHAHTNLGRVLARKGDLDGAIASHREAIRHNPTHARAHTNLGNALATKGDLDGAIACFREAIRLDPKHATANANLGLALEKKGDLDGAVGYYKEALRIDPKHPNAHYNLGVVRNRQGDLDGAIACFREAIRHDPEHVDAHYNLGVVLAKKGELDAAIGHCKEAIRLDPGHAAAHHNLGVHLFHKGDVDGAIACYREAIRLDPTDPDTHYRLGLALTRSRDAKGAVRCFREAIRLDPKYPLAHYNLGIMLFETGDVDGAIACLQEAIRLDPKYANAHYNLGVLLLDKGDVDGAIGCYREAIRLDPKSTRAHNNLGNALFRKGDMEGAIGCYREAIRLDPKYANAHNNLGRVLQARNDLDGAAAAYREAARLDPKRFGGLLKNNPRQAPPVAPPPRPVVR
jgi:tetratricopeptide (TPR) repeat protein